MNQKQIRAAVEAMLFAHAEPPQPLEMEEPKPEENDPFEDIFKIFQNRD